MTEDDKPSSGEEQIDERGRNPTQQRIDEEGSQPRPVQPRPAAPDPAEDEPWAT
jgi:hypothetical protein